MAIGDFIRKFSKAAPASAEDAAIAKLWDDFLAEAKQVQNTYGTDFTKLSSAQPIIDLPAPQKLAALLSGMRRLAECSQRLKGVQSLSMGDDSWRKGNAIKDIVARLLQPELPFDAVSLATLLDRAVASDSIWVRFPV